MHGGDFPTFDVLLRKLGLSFDLRVDGVVSTGVGVETRLHFEPALPDQNIVGEGPLAAEDFNTQPLARGILFILGRGRLQFRREAPAQRHLQRFKKHLFIKPRQKGFTRNNSMLLYLRPPRSGINKTVAAVEEDFVEVA